MTGFLGDPWASALLSTLAGALITWVVSRNYYKRAGDELKAEAARLQRTSELILRWLELRGEDVSVLRDEAGRPAGLSRTIGVADALSVGAQPVGGELRTAPNSEER